MNTTDAWYNNQQWLVFADIRCLSHLFRYWQKSKAVSLQNVSSSVVDDHIWSKLTQSFFQIPSHTVDT